MDLSSWMGWVRFPGSWASMTHEGHQGLNCVVLVPKPIAHEKMPAASKLETFGWWMAQG